MYKILHIPSGLILDHPADVNKEEADKTIKWLCRLHKQYLAASPGTRRYMGAATKLFTKMDRLHETDLEAFFVVEKKQRFQIMDVSSLKMYPEYYSSEKQASEALAKALRKQHKDISTLRKWCLSNIPAASVSGTLFDNFKQDWSNKTGHFQIVEV